MYTHTHTHNFAAHLRLAQHCGLIILQFLKVGLKLNHQKMKTMACSPITSWQMDGETVETVTDFISGGSKITADGDCLGREVMTNLDSILKSRDITLLTKVHLVKALSFQ